ncbi:MAG: GGDEF domain-containing protein [Burkholderiaceae bacterium]|nr:GGDEF domain-containing protein [Rhodoferax sp.]MCP5286806.1 GGDEF domain-containing protein [Burkholderiaceae bacterium]
MSKVLRSALGWLLAYALCVWPAAARVPTPWPPVLAETLEASLDDPHSVLEPERRRAVAAQGEERFWRWLAVSRLEWTLEMDEAAAHSVQRAGDALAAMPQAPPEAAWWLQAARLKLAVVGADAAAQVRPLAALRAQIPPGPSVLRCDLLDIETWVLHLIDSLDEAWRSAEAQGACGQETGWSFFEAQAALVQGQIASADKGRPDARAAVLAHFARAESLLASGGARYLRSLVAYAAAMSLGGMAIPADALPFAERALAASRDLGDRAGIAAGLIELADLDIDMGRPAAALPRLQEAEGLLGDIGDTSRPVHVNSLRLRAMTALRHPGLAMALEQAARLDLSTQLPKTQQQLALAMAEAQAALGRHEAAYASMQRARKLEEQARQIGRDTQVLLLQARYDTARRDAEIANLKHRDDAAQLSLQAQAATQRALWVVLAALTLLLTAAAFLGWRAWRSRRELAALALRDELTGLPNRRAIEAYARAQLVQSQRLGLPFTLVLLDLDHFKQVNDRFGHPAGDALLQALSRVVPQVLRAPDRLGRWGGEEFMLVLPGTRSDEIGGVFARLLTAFGVVDVAGLPSPHGVTFSMGGVQAGPGDGFDALLKQADDRLYAAKDAGRATWR